MSHCIIIDYLFDFMTIFLISASFSIIFASFLTIHTFLEPYDHKNTNGSLRSPLMTVLASLALKIDSSLHKHTPY